MTPWFAAQDEVQFVHPSKVSKPGLLPIWLARPVGWTFFGLFLLCGMAWDLSFAYGIVMLLGGMVP